MRADRTREDDGDRQEARHPVDLARQLLDALNTEEIDEAWSLFGELVDRLGLSARPSKKWDALDEARVQMGQGLITDTCFDEAGESGDR